MNFEEQFPSLEPYDWFWGSLETKKDFIKLSKDIAKESFTPKFVHVMDVQKNCLDKQRVIELQKKWSSALDYIGLDLLKELGLEEEEE
jgi:hypothetical protein